VSASPNFQPSGRGQRPELPSAFARECAFVSENIEAHALGALTTEESERVERHVSTCPRCAARLEQSRAVSAFLPFLAAPVAVPESAHARLFERVMLDRPAAASAAPLPNLNPWEASEPERSWTIPSSKEAFAAPLDSVGVASRRRRVNWDVWAAPLAAMPLVLALAIVGGWALNTRSNLQDQRAAMNQVLQENKNLQGQLLTYPTATVAAVDHTDIQLDAVNGSAAQGALTQLSANGAVALRVWNLPTNVKSCEVDLETMDGNHINGGTFNVDGNGSATATLSLSGPLSAYRNVRVIPIMGASIGDSSGNAAAPELLTAQINSNLGWPDGTEANANPR
jgi:anti-sigma factor RsiW